jgi:hypothetical protein
VEALIAMEGEGLFWARHYPEFIDHMLGWLGTQQTDPSEYEKLHKGTPFYYLGMAAFLSHDYQSATFFFDAAASEDFNVADSDQQPAHLFLCLDADNPRQAARQIVERLVHKLEQTLGDYNERHDDAPLLVSEVRKYFLRPQMVKDAGKERRTLVTTFISFLAEWDHRLRMIEISGAGSMEPFFTHLFRGCLLFESLLKWEPTGTVDKKATLGVLLNQTPWLTGCMNIRSDLPTSCYDFDALLQSIRSKTTSIPDIETAIEFTAKTRNTLGHSLVWAVQLLDRETYDLLARNIATSCLHAISTLYVRRNDV